MTTYLHMFFDAAPLAAVALALALGYLCGKIRIGGRIWAERPGAGSP